MVVNSISEWNKLKNKLRWSLKFVKASFWRQDLRSRHNIIAYMVRLAMWYSAWFNETLLTEEQLKNEKKGGRSVNNFTAHGERTSPVHSASFSCWSMQWEFVSRITSLTSHRKGPYVAFPQWNLLHNLVTLDSFCPMFAPRFYTCFSLYAP